MISIVVDGPIIDVVDEKYDAIRQAIETNEPASYVYRGQEITITPSTAKHLLHLIAAHRLLKYARACQRLQEEIKKAEENIAFIEEQTGIDADQVLAEKSGLKRA